MSSITSKKQTEKKLTWGIIVKPSQNKKGRKFSSCTIFYSFFIAGSWEKGIKNDAARKLFNPSYFVTALVKSNSYFGRIVGLKKTLWLCLTSTHPPLGFLDFSTALCLVWKICDTRISNNRYLLCTITDIYYVLYQKSLILTNWPNNWHYHVTK